MSDEKPPGESSRPAVTPRGEHGDVAAGHEAPQALQEGHEVPETRGHQPAEGGRIELGHDPPADLVIVQQVGEMHSPAEEALAPTMAPPEPADAAQTVTPPEAHQAVPSTSGDGGDAQND